MILQWILLAILGMTVPSHFQVWYWIILILYAIYLVGKKIVEVYGKSDHDYDDYDDYNDWSE